MGRLTDEELDEVRIAAAGFHGRFEFDPAHTEDRGIGYVYDRVDFDDRLVYVPEGGDTRDDDAHTIASMIEGHIARPMATMLNAAGPLVAELRERRASDLSDEEREALRMLRVMLREDDDIKLRYGWQQRYRAALAALDKVLKEPKP